MKRREIQVKDYSKVITISYTGIKINAEHNSRIHKICCFQSTFEDILYFMQLEFAHYRLRDKQFRLMFNSLKVLEKPIYLILRRERNDEEHPDINIYLSLVSRFISFDNSVSLL